MSGYQALIFDMDGVLVDSEPLFLKAINNLLLKESAEPVTDEENQNTLIGTTVEETWRRLIEMRSLPESLQSYLGKYDLAVKAVLQAELIPRPGVRSLIETCSQRKLPKAVASSSLRSWVHLKLETLGFQDSFEVVLGGDDVTRGKPEPDIYLLAADRLNIPPARCIAIEDSPVGIAAAVSAGIYTVAVLTDSTRGMDLSQAQQVLKTLESFDLNLLRT
jgi:HAD superfamily hydrolase (TIGR01509 family)